MSKTYKPKLFYFALFLAVILAQYTIVSFEVFSLSLVSFMLAALLLSICLLLYLFYIRYASYSLQITDKEVIVAYKYSEDCIPFDECQLSEGFLVSDKCTIFIGYSNLIFGRELIRELKKHIEHKDFLNFNESLWLIGRVGYTHPVYIVLLIMSYILLVAFLA